MECKVHSDEVLDGNEEHIIVHWRKGHPCFKVMKNLAELCVFPSVLWKIKLASNESGRLAKAISMQNVEGVTRLLLTAYTKL